MDEREDEAMSETVIHVDGDAAVKVLDEHGWTQGDYGGGDGPVCLHGAIRLCQPVPGDAYLIEQIEQVKDRWSTGWNDDVDRTEVEVRSVLAGGLDYTDADLAETFGPQWRAVVSLVRRAAVLTEDEALRMRAAGDAARAAARAAAWGAAWDAAWDAAGDAARAAAGDAARAAARAAAWDAARAAARAAAGDAARAAATWDLAPPDGSYTFAHRDLLMAPWVEVCGMPEGLIDEVQR